MSKSDIQWPSRKIAVAVIVLVAAFVAIVGTEPVITARPRSNRLNIGGSFPAFGNFGNLGNTLRCIG